MRSAIVGAFFAGDPERRRSFTLASSRLTHRGWQAEVAALAVAEAATQTISGAAWSGPSSLGPAWRALSAESEWQDKLTRMETGLAQGASVSTFARDLGLEAGVSGYALHVVPVALYAWLRHPDDAGSALGAALECGGDTDTVGAIVGGLAGATHGAAGFPKEWVDRILEWPRSMGFARQLAQKLVAQGQASRPLGPVRWFWPAQPLRNLLFLAIVLAHGFRRMMPW